MASNLSAVELLKMGDQNRQKPFLNIYWPYILGTFFGAGTATMINFGTRRPLFSGLQKHIIGVAVWCGILHFVQEKRDRYFAERDAVYRHYIELHPEDFKEPPKRKIADVLEPWIPVR